MTTTQAHDTSDIERRARDLRAEITRLKARRRELVGRLNAAYGQSVRHKGAGRKTRSAGTHRAAHTLEIERDQIDERIAVLEATARSTINSAMQAFATSTRPIHTVEHSDIQSYSPQDPQGASTVISFSRLPKPGLYQKWVSIPHRSRSRFLWTIGNALMLIGVVLLLYVGGVYTQAEYDRYAARGDTDIPVPRVVAAPASYEPAPFTAPILNSSNTAEGPVRGAIPDAARAAHQSTITRVIIPSIGVDSKVVEVGWDVTQQNGQDVAIWQVAEYAVGQHRGSANPGEGDNVVLAGHVGGYGKVFKNLFYINPGDQITLYSGGQQYLYIVQGRLILTEEGVSPEQQAANAQYIGPAADETVTLVTCWPPKGPDKFTQRVVVRAVPFGANVASQQQLQSSWTLR